MLRPQASAMRQMDEGLAARKRCLCKGGSVDVSLCGMYPLACTRAAFRAMLAGCLAQSWAKDLGVVSQNGSLLVLCAGGTTAGASFEHRISVGRSRPSQSCCSFPAPGLEGENTSIRLWRSVVQQAMPAFSHEQRG
jgi:hypothetical protein